MTIDVNCWVLCRGHRHPLCRREKAIDELATQTSANLRYDNLGATVLQVMHDQPHVVAHTVLLPAFARPISSDGGSTVCGCDRTIFRDMRLLHK